jgi:hypothetical protein
MEKWIIYEIKYQLNISRFLNKFFKFILQLLIKFNNYLNYSFILKLIIFFIIIIINKINQEDSEVGA